ncbi:GNAT family N-acetyltransferase [Streptomyces sp. M41]|uniref:GNAT family N-acetyltransferase n=1 Tax=Streptomyces sp. M41 TaxID=3059412 RepID=UPI00374CD2E7
MGWHTLARAELENEHVLLRPLVADDREALRRIAEEEEFERVFAGLLAGQRAGRSAVFHIADRTSGRSAGTVSFDDLAEADGRVEIGRPWPATAGPGTDVGHWATYLLLEHAFEGLRAQRAGFRTDVLDLRARRELRDIGATEEGVLRSYEPAPGGRRRDAVCFSVLAFEWPEVKRRLAAGPRGRRSKTH